MKVFSLQVLRKDGDGKAVTLKTADDLYSFRFFERTAVKEFFVFSGKLLVERTAVGTRSTVQERGYYCHIHMRSDGLAGVTVTDGEYQSRVAFSMITRVLDDFVQKTPDWKSINDEKACGYAGLQEFLTRYQNPREADPLTRVQEEVDETRVIMHNTIQSVLERGERLEDLVDKSENLSNQAKLFYTQARKYNSCCNYG